MSVSYKAVQWTRQKIWYDVLLVGGVGLYLGLFHLLAPLFLDQNAGVDPMNLRIRGYGSAAYILLHVILSIGPLCRLDKRFLPLLYNRRHMGVTMCVLGLLHAKTAITWYHDYGPVNPLVSLFVSNTNVDSLTRFPFELLGVVALLILVLMAVTSHDFWLANLSAPVWKALHMLVYPAYALLVGHVALGALQTHQSPFLAALVGLGMAWVIGIHLVAGWRERKGDADTPEVREGWVEVGAAEAIPDNRAQIVNAGGERIAVFRYGDQISAISNVCQHQNGPLGEGCIVDGLVTCPWHGYQYCPRDGASPAPFTEKVPTFKVRVTRDGTAWVDPRPLPAGTSVEPAKLPGSAPKAERASEPEASDE